MPASQRPHRVRDVGSINEWWRGVLGEPIFDVGSPKQMKEFCTRCSTSGSHREPRPRTSVSQAPCSPPSSTGAQEGVGGTLDAMPTEEELESRGLEIPDEFRAGSTRC